MRSALLVLLVLLLALIGCGQAYTFHGTRLEPPLPPAEFTLTDQHEQTMRLSDFRGQFVLLFFGYTHCPDACPLTLGQFKEIRNTLGDDAARVRFVMITVDPARDTPERMREYLAQFDLSFIGLTGSEEALAAVYRAYGVSVEAILGETVSTLNATDHHHHSSDDSASTTTLAHTSSVYLLDKEGRARLIFTGLPWQDMLADLKQMMLAGLE